MLFGKFANFFGKIGISYSNEELTLVEYFDNETTVKVNRFKLKRKSQHESDGETVMLCNDQLVYKRLYMYRDGANQNIDIDEYSVGCASLRPDHSSKLLFGFRYQFFQENGTEKLKAFKLVPGLPLKVTGWFWKVDSDNRRYDDVPLLPHLVNDLRIKYLNQMIALPGFDIEFSREDEEWMYNATIAAETLEDITIAVDW